MKQFVSGKLHGIRVTGADLHYHGSITLDPDHAEAAGILPMEFVDIWNRDSGARISTYVIYGQRGSKCCILNGAAARTCQKGDALIICSSDYLEPEAVTRIEPTVLAFDADNNVIEVLRYHARHDAEGRLTFRLLDETDADKPVPYSSQK